MRIRQIAAVQLLLRLTISAAFLSAVADRFGFWSADVSSWGNWENFLTYSQSVNSFASPQMNKILAIIATILETLLSLLLLIGFKIKWAAIASALLLFGFGVAMTYSFGIKPSLDYSVWTVMAASYALSRFNSYPFSIDYFVTTSCLA